MELLIVLVSALALDQLLGEPKHHHPLVYFGNLATALEKRLYKADFPAVMQTILGFLVVAIMVAPLPLIYQLLSDFISWFWLVDILVLYLALGMKSLWQHGMQVHDPLMQGDLSQARFYCGWLVSRDTDELDEQQISRAVVESMLENGHDAVIASLFWYLVGGIPMVIAHRLINTLDAMWGYRTERYLHYGYCAARSDDLLGWPSAKMTAFLYALQGRTLFCLRNAARQAPRYKSLNGGWAMASGASALNIELGGTASYFGNNVESPVLGAGRQVQAQDIFHSLRLVQWAAILFVALVAICLCMGTFFE